MKTASNINFGEIATISDVDTSHPSAKRILEVGFTPGQEIQLVNKSILNGPIAFAIRGTLIALRKSDADCIIVA